MDSSRARVLKHNPVVWKALELGSKIPAMLHTSDKFIQILCASSLFVRSLHSFVTGMSAAMS